MFLLTLLFLRLLKTQLQHSLKSVSLVANVQRIKLLYIKGGTEWNFWKIITIILTLVLNWNIVDGILSFIRSKSVDIAKKNYL